MGNSIENEASPARRLAYTWYLALKQETRKVSVVVVMKTAAVLGKYVMLLCHIP